MVLVDVPVETGEDTISGGLHIVTLPRTCGQSVGVLQIGRKTFKFLNLRTVVGIGIRRTAITSTGSRTSGHIVLDFAIDEEEKLVLDDRASEGDAVGVAVSVIDRQRRRSHTRTLQ